MVQKGKFSAPIPALVNALNKVDLPTLGKPTIPQLKPMMICSVVVKLMMLKVNLYVFNVHL
jgi:uncharacterized protein (DUF2062 family)